MYFVFLMLHCHWSRSYQISDSSHFSNYHQCTLHSHKWIPFLGCILGIIVSSNLRISNIWRNGTKKTWQYVAQICFRVFQGFPDSKQWHTHRNWSIIRHKDIMNRSPYRYVLYNTWSLAITNVDNKNILYHSHMRTFLYTVEIKTTNRWIWMASVECCHTNISFNQCFNLDYITASIDSGKYFNIIF